jgi:hypothetical protein
MVHGHCFVLLCQEAFINIWNFSGPPQPGDQDFNKLDFVLSQKDFM